ncbi:hypothetical protein PC113_g2231 [Phytophthora cactorum]|uniref:Uncharacterized protein n=1 Tax=Phytophthora cactorum TaxID=29920 RepID=A0A8T1DQZ3_9STRA|nr:hypothetical protein PC113_g2231 [Phytophthora cactorum]KAG2930988.1 hypothetical protein PC114_g2341 [Phytophthora cactorum]KAG2942189.1 hypothetical protein PC115_g1599 [Phytophthora cactorum]KAG3096788.1 hypothetical protein PC121_g2383 [Phytophthora cactorum]
MGVVIEIVASQQRLPDDIAVPDHLAVEFPITKDSSSFSSTSSSTMMALRVSGVREEALGMDSRMELDALHSSLPHEDDSNWTPSHLRLLYLLSRFATYPSSTDEEEKWLRSLPLQVMVFEAIVHGLLAFDYSPVCTSIVKDGQSRRLWLNMSHDARAAIDDLREHELVKALKTCSEDFQPSTAYQVTQEGMTVLASLPPRDKQRLDEFLTAPRNSLSDIVSAPVESPRLGPRPLTTTNPSGLVLVENLLLKITYDPDKGHFRIRRGDGSVYVSRVTDIEEVSYVSSPYLPSCLMRNGTANFSSNAWQAEKCRKGAASVGSSSIQDADLSFAIVLENVRLMVGEWIPFGPNQIVLLNDRLGSLERCQGGLFTSELDDAPTSTSLAIEPGLTKIAIVDFEFDCFTNFEADIYAPIEDGIIQIESFGMHLNGDGSIVYGMEIDATMDRSADFLCVDHLARLLVDVDLDSSKIINDLLSSHQRGLLDMLFMGDARSRNKFALLTASGISPKLPARAYLDRGEKENELKQVLGELHSVHDIGKDDKLLVGHDGMLLAGPNANKHEPLLVAHLALLSRELVVRFFFKRTFILGDVLARARNYMTSFEMNPEALDDMRDRVSRCAHDLVLLEEILELLRESLRGLAHTIPSRPTPCEDDPTGGGAALYDHLQLRKTHKDLEMRCKDLAKLLRGFRAKLKQVQSQNGTMAKMMLEGLVLGVERNVAVLAEVTRANQRSLKGSFDVLLLMFAAILAFELLDRITDGNLLGMDKATAPSLQWIKNLVVENFIGYPALWFVINMIWLVVVIWLVRAGIRLGSRRLTRTQRMVFANAPRRINVAAFEQFLRTPLDELVPSEESSAARARCTSRRKRVIEARKASVRESIRVVNVLWSEPAVRPKCQTWMELFVTVRQNWELFIAPPVRTQVTYDATNGFLLDVIVHAGLTTNCSEIYDQLKRQMESTGCFDEHYTPPTVSKPEDSPPNSNSRRGFFVPRSIARWNAPVHPTHGV